MGVLVVSKSFIVREALESFFSREFGEYRFKGVNNLSEVINIDLEKIKFIFFDIEGEFIEYINLVKEHFKNIKMMIFDKSNSKKCFMSSIKGGIEGYIVDIPEKDDFTHIINKILRGKTYYDTDLLQNLMHKDQDEFAKLTERETEVLDEVRKGLTNKQIAQNLFITEHTIKKHITSILFKLDMNNRKQLIINCR